MISVAPIEADQLGKSLNIYARFVKLTPREIMQKKGRDISIKFSQYLKEIAPAKGSIRTDRLVALKEGGGVYVRPSIVQKVFAKYQARQEIGSRKVVFGRRGASVNSKGLNLQALAIKMELNLRESGRMSLAASALFPSAFGDRQFSKSKFGGSLAEADISQDGSKLSFEWSPRVGAMSAHVAEGLNTEKGSLALARAIRDVRDDVTKYTDRKFAEAAKKAGLV